MKSGVQKNMEIVAMISFLATVCGVVLYYYTGEYFSFAITAGTIFYHVAMRLFVGTLANQRKIKECLKVDSAWFQQKNFEKKLYKKLNVKKWKGRMPVYLPDDFDIKKNSVQEIVKNMCRAEIVHEITAAASWISLTFSLIGDEWKSDILIFTVTALAASICDLLFVIIQRFNRPRLMAVMKKMEEL